MDCSVLGSEWMLEAKIVDRVGNVKERVQSTLPFIVFLQAIKLNVLTAALQKLGVVLYGFFDALRLNSNVSLCDCGRAVL